MADRRAPYWLILVVTYLVGASCQTGDPRTSTEPARATAALEAVSDGKADATEVLQRVIDSGAGIVRLPRGTYRVTRPIVVDLNRVGFTSISGGGVARLVMEGPGPALKIIGTHQGTADPGTVDEAVWRRQRMPTIVGLEIVGAHEEAVGIEATGTMQLIVQRVNIRRALHGVHLTTRNRNVIIAECHV